MVKNVSVQNILTEGVSLVTYTYLWKRWLARKIDVLVFVMKNQYW